MHIYILIHAQVTITLMAFQIAAANIAANIAARGNAILAIQIIIIGSVFSFQLMGVVITEIVHLCVRICRRTNTKCFLTWVGVT